MYLSLKPSKYLTAIFAIIALINISIIFTVVKFLPLWVSAILILICLLQAGWCIAQYALLMLPTSIHEIICHNDDSWVLTNKKGQITSATLCGNSIRSRYFLLLNFKIIAKKWRKITVMVMPDQLFTEAFRQLRVRLLLMATSDAGVKIQSRLENSHKS